MNSGTIWSIIVDFDFCRFHQGHVAAILRMSFTRLSSRAQNGAKWRAEKQDLLGHDFYCLFTSDNAEI